MYRFVLSLFACLVLAACGSPYGQPGQFLSSDAVPVGGSLFVDRDSEGYEYLTLDGEIDAETAVAFENFIELYDVETLIIVFSPGGIIGASHQIGRLIQRDRMNTVILAECSSACADVFVAGRVREMYEGSVLGMHATADPSESYEVDLAYYSALGFGDLLKRSYQVPSTQIWLISPDEALKMGVATHIIR